MTKLTLDQAKLGMSIAQFLLYSPASRALVNERDPRKALALGAMFNAYANVAARIITEQLDGLEHYFGEPIERDYQQMHFSFPSDETAVSGRGVLIMALFKDESCQEFSTVVTDSLLPRALQAVDQARDFGGASDQLIADYEPSMRHPSNRSGWLALTLPLIVRHAYPSLPENGPVLGLLTNFGNSLQDMNRSVLNSESAALEA